jgi:hypothetical protein
MVCGLMRGALRNAYERKQANRRKF